MTYLGTGAFGLSAFRSLVPELVDVALQSDKGLLLGAHALESLRRRRIVLPRLDVIDRACARGIAHANRTLHRRLAAGSTDDRRVRLNVLLDRRDGEPATCLNWLRRSPAAPNSRAMLEHLERFEHYRSLEPPAALGTDVHQNRLPRIAREGARMRPADLAGFEPERRHAALAAVRDVGPERDALSSAPAYLPLRHWSDHDRCTRLERTRRLPSRAAVLDDRVRPLIGGACCRRM